MKNKRIIIGILLVFTLVLGGIAVYVGIRMSQNVGELPQTGKTGISCSCNNWKEGMYCDGEDCTFENVPTDHCEVGQIGTCYHFDLNGDATVTCQSGSFAGKCDCECNTDDAPDKEGYEKVDCDSDGATNNTRYLSNCKECRNPYFCEICYKKTPTNFSCGSTCRNDIECPGPYSAEFKTCDADGTNCTTETKTGLSGECKFPSTPPGGTPSPIGNCSIIGASLDPKYTTCASFNDATHSYTQDGYCGCKATRPITNLCPYTNVTVQTHVDTDKNNDIFKFTDSYTSLPSYTLDLPAYLDIRCMGKKSNNDLELIINPLISIQLGNTKNVIVDSNGLVKNSPLSAVGTYTVFCEASDFAGTSNYDQCKGQNVFKLSTTTPSCGGSCTGNNCNPTTPVLYVCDNLGQNCGIDTDATSKSIPVICETNKCIISSNACDTFGSDYYKYGDCACAKNKLVPTAIISDEADRILLGAVIFLVGLLIIKTGWYVKLGNLVWYKGTLKIASVFNSKAREVALDAEREDFENKF